MWLLLFPLVIIAGVAAYFFAGKPPKASILWQHTSSDYVGDVYIQPQAEGNLVVFSLLGIEFFNSSGNVVSYPTGSAYCSIFGLGSVEDSQGNLYFCLADSLTSRTSAGDLRWSFNLSSIEHRELPQGFNLYHSQVIAGDQVLVADYCGNIALFNSDGTLEHSSSIDYTIFAPPIAVDDGTFALSIADPAKQNSYSIALINREGNIVQQFPTPFGGSLTPIKNGILINQEHSPITAFNRDGTASWTYTNTDQLRPTAITHNYSLTTYSDEIVFIASDEHAAAIDADGTVLWDLRFNHVAGIAVESRQTQYVIDCEWSTGASRIRQWLRHRLIKRKSNLIGLIPAVTVNCTLVRIDDGRITRRWELPNNIGQFAGPDERGRLYLYSSKDNTLYCVEP